jgi:hypothetical protein
MSEFTAKSGAKVVINVAPWADAKRLKAAIEKEASASGIKFDLKADISTIVSTMLSIDSSPVVDAALWPCLARCTRADAKITEATFDKVDAREDYYEIMNACLLENFRPLFESLLSVLPESLATIFTKQAKTNPESQNS